MGLSGSLHPPRCFARSSPEQELQLSVLHSFSASGCQEGVSGAAGELFSSESDGTDHPVCPSPQTDCPFEDVHDWTECPFAHNGEKARRRDPRKWSYSSQACPSFRKASAPVQTA